MTHPYLELTISLLALAWITACASGPKNARVVETESGLLQSIASDENEADAAIAAIDAASNYCKDRDKRAVFADEKQLSDTKKKDGSAEETLEAIIRHIPVVGRTVASEDGDGKTQLMAKFRCR